MVIATRVENILALHRLAYILSILGIGINDKLPSVFVCLSTLCVFGWSSFSLLKLMHILCLGGSQGADSLGTMMIGLAQGLILFLMTPAHSNVLISC